MYTWAMMHVHGHFLYYVRHFPPPVVFVRQFPVLHFPVLQFQSPHRKHVGLCDFLLVINNNLGPTLHRLGDTVA